MAESKGLSLTDFQQYCEENPEVDKALDAAFCQEARLHPACILDFRLGALFFPRALRVWLEAPLSVIAERVLVSRQGLAEVPSGSTLEDVAIQLKLRNIMSRNRFIQLYNFDYYDPQHYDLIISTAEMPVNAIAAQVVARIG
jgi:cytidylate kinase